MRRIVAPFMVLLLAVLHAPTRALALVPPFLSDLLPTGTNEPVMLLVTGMALLSLSRIGAGRHRSVNAVAQSSFVAPATESRSPEALKRAA